MKSKSGGIKGGTDGDNKIEGLQPLYNANQVAVLLGIHKDEVYRMASASELPSLKIKNRRRFPRRWIAKFLADSGRCEGVDLDHYGEAI